MEMDLHHEYWASNSWKGTRFGTSYPNQIKAYPQSWHEHLHFLISPHGKSRRLQNVWGLEEKLGWREDDQPLVMAASFLGIGGEVSQKPCWEHAEASFNLEHSDYPLTLSGEFFIHLSVDFSSKPQSPQLQLQPGPSSEVIFYFMFVEHLRPSDCFSLSWGHLKFLSVQSWLCFRHHSPICTLDPIT